jgi:DNA-binding response OmpR family regulator
MPILIADDDHVSTTMLGRTLEQWGFEVVVAQVERDISAHADAWFTHGICLPCMASLMAEFKASEERRAGR